MQIVLAACWLSSGSLLQASSSAAMSILRYLPTGAGSEVSGACPTAHRSTFLSHCSGSVACWTTFGLKDRAIFHGSISNADPRAPGHVTSCLQLMLYGCTRAICELKGIYNVQLKVLIYKYILVGQYAK